MNLSYLPIHAQMEKCLTKDMKVVHNGAGNRQGMKGTIVKVNAGKDIDFVLVRFGVGSGASQYYSRKWFLANYYISLPSIEKMGGFFNGTPYIKKYEGYELPATAFNVQRMTHGQCKSHLETVAGGYTPVIDNKGQGTESITVAAIDPLDEVGEYFVLGDVKTLAHKTQRIAELRAGYLAKTNNCTYMVVKVVSTAELVQSYEIKRK